ncbi:MAG: hypothetical protein FJ255_06535 [Phycisphaerae bacterium]|nr:hypothetical protein [Phycisphaerae bacterium]
MADNYRALCSDFYVNMKLQVKMELPRTRETVLEFFERVRRQFPSMTGFRRFRDELALEAPQSEMPHRWLAVRGSAIRSGVVNAATLAESYALHLQILESCPHYLSVSPLDVDHLELLFGFDLLAHGNHDAIVLDAMLASTPLASLLDIPGATPVEFQPLVALALPAEDGSPALEAAFEIKTRPQGRGQPHDQDSPGEPISVCLSLRRPAPFGDLKDLPLSFHAMARRGEELIESRLVPNLLLPLRDAIASNNG